MRTRRIKLKDFIEEIEKKKNERLIAISAIDEKKSFHILYHFDGKKFETLELTVPKKKHVPSIMFIFPSAEIYEREVHDFFDIEFENNPNLHEKLFLPEDWKGKPPLLK